MIEGDPVARGFDALQFMLASVFLLAGLPKIIGTWRMRAMFDHLRVPQPMRIATGAIEVFAACGLFIGLLEREIAIAAALLACPLMLGATMTNLTRSRRRDAWLTTAILLLLCVLVAYVRFAQQLQR